MGIFRIPISNALIDGIVDALLSLVWSILTGLMWIVDQLQTAFFFITGVDKLPLSMNGSQVELTLLELLFGISKNGEALDFTMPLHQVYIGMLGVFAIVFVFFIVCSIVKIQINRESRENLPSMRKMLWKCACAFFIVILLPLIFCLLLSFSGVFMETLINLLKLDLLAGDSELSISECLFKASLSPEAFEKLSDPSKISWMNPDGSAMSYEQLLATYGDGGVSFILLLIAVCCCLIGIGSSVLSVAERLINIALLYVVAPVVIASIPLDDGRRWESWKDTTTVKILTAAANVISIYIFIYIMKEFGNVILNGQGNTIFSIVYIVIAISGAFGCAKAGTVLATLISANAGQQEGMSFLGTQAMLRTAGSLAGGVLKGAAWLTGLNKLTNQNGNNATTTNGGTGGGIGALFGGQQNDVSDTAYTTDNSQPSNTYNSMQQMKLSAGDENSLSGGRALRRGITDGVGTGMGNTAKKPLQGVAAVGRGIQAGAGVVGTVLSNFNLPGLIKLAGAVVGGGLALAFGGAKLISNLVHNGIDSIKGKIKSKHIQRNLKNSEVSKAAEVSGGAIKDASKSNVSVGDSAFTNGTGTGRVKTNNPGLTTPGLTSGPNNSVQTGGDSSTVSSTSQQKPLGLGTDSGQQNPTGNNVKPTQQKPLGANNVQPNGNNGGTTKTKTQSAQKPTSNNSGSGVTINVNINPPNNLQSGGQTTKPTPKKSDQKVDALKKKLNPQNNQGSNNGGEQ